MKFVIHGFTVDLLQCFLVYTQFHVFLYPFWFILIPRIGYHYQKILHHHKTAFIRANTEVDELGNLAEYCSLQDFSQPQPHFTGVQSEIIDHMSY